MGLTAALTGIAAVGVMAIYATLKLTKWSLNAEAEEVRHLHVKHVWRVSKVAIAAIVGLEIWPGLASWAAELWNLLPI